MDLSPISDRIGDLPTAALAGLVVGVLFGFAAQRSAFCLRAATVEFARGRLGARLGVWLLTFSSAVVWVQAARIKGWFDPEEARMMAVTGSISGAIIGGQRLGRTGDEAGLFDGAAFGSDPVRDTTILARRLVADAYALHEARMRKPDKPLRARQLLQQARGLGHPGLPGWGQGKSRGASSARRSAHACRSRCSRPIPRPSSRPRHGAAYPR